MMHENEQIKAVVFKCQLDASPHALGDVGGATSLVCTNVGEQPPGCECSLLIIQPVTVLGVIRQDDSCGEGNSDGGDPLDNEEPTLSCMLVQNTAYRIHRHLPNRRCQQHLQGP